MATITTIEGIGPAKARKLRAAGGRTTENLAAAMLETNTAGRNRLVKRPPSSKVVQGWVDKAKDLPPAVTH